MSQDELIAELKARIRDLEVALGQHNEKMAMAFRLPPQMNAVLGLLLALPSVTPEVIRQRLELATDAKVTVHRLRKRLQPWGIVISSRRNFGYWLEPSMKEKVRALIAEAANNGTQAPTASTPVNQEAEPATATPA